MKKIIISLFLIFILVGCQKDEITYRCESFDSKGGSEVLVLKVTGDYKEVIELYVEISLEFDENDSDEFKESIKKSFEKASPHIEYNIVDNKLVGTINGLDMLESIQTTKENIKNLIAHYEKDEGYSCKIID